MSFKYSERYRLIGIKIAKYRLKKGFIQEQLANKIGISYSYLAQIEAPNDVKNVSRSFIRYCRWPKYRCKRFIIGDFNTY